MFAIPMTVVAIVMSDSYITLLRSEYPDASIILIVSAVDILISVTSNIFSYVLFGMESMDQDEKISFKALVKSRLFIAFSMPYINSAIALPLTYFVLTTYAFNQPLQAAFYVSIIVLISRCVSLAVLYTLARKSTKIDIPWKNISKYVLASAIMGAVLFLLPHPVGLPATAGTMEILFNIGKVLAITGIGAAVYLVIIMAIDKEARMLPKSLLQEVRGKKKPPT
jgi:hypothetical protein